MEEIPEAGRRHIDANRNNEFVLKVIASSLKKEMLVAEAERELLCDVVEKDTTKSLWYKILKEEMLRRMPV